MKLPDAIAGLNKEKLLDFALRHGDKAVLAIIALFSCGLAWGGIDSLRSQSVSSARLPKAIEQAASQAEGHINQFEKPPESVRVKAEPLAAKVERWQAPKLAPATPLFDKPLFEELAKRTKPNVFPVEDVRATAGVVVLAVRDPSANAAASSGGDREKPNNRDKGGGGKRPAKRAESNPADPFGNSGGTQRAAGSPSTADAAESPPGRIVPFVVVTGLIPHDKQIREYESRFSQTSYPDPKRDVPAWSEYIVERTEVRAGGQENWERIDQKLLSRKAREEWAGIQPESLPVGLLMPASGGAGQQPAGPAFGTACLPLPRLAAGAWGPETMHPRFLPIIKDSWAGGRQQPQSGPPSPAPGLDTTEDRPAARPDFSPADEQPEANQEPAAGPAQGSGPAADQPVVPPQRLFRIVDTTVKPGRSYRYRVLLKVWNPNWKLPARHLDDPEIAKDDRLSSAASEPTAAVQVPVPGYVLVRSLTKADTKKLKSGQFEVLAVGESRKQGNFAFGSIITEVGGLVNIDARLNKPGDVRVRGEDLATDCVVVDLHGRQQDRAEERASGRSPAPSEPFELLVQKPDGSFTVASVPDSQEVIEELIEMKISPPAIEPSAKPPTGGPPAAGPRSPAPF